MKPRGHSAKPATSSQAVCEACGHGEAIFIGDRWICADCISVAGSCCPEFGAWDAWSSPSGVVPQCYINRDDRPTDPSHAGNLRKLHT